MQLTHDADPEVSQGAIFGLGLIAAGTNNSRAAKLLRSLSAYYYKEPNHLFVVRLAQGLLHMGKGTLALAPFHSEGLMHRVAFAGLLATMHACLDMKNRTSPDPARRVWVVCVCRVVSCVVWC
jgi:26S proteasome regulatory subunit N1